MDYQIKDATRQEAPLLSALIRESFHDVARQFRLTQDNCPTHPAFCQVSWITEAMDRQVKFYLLTLDQEPAGCVALEWAKVDTCYLERLAVLRQYRGRGLGTMLVNHALDQARQLGVAKVDLTIIARHVELQNWYERLGFTLRKTATYPHLPFEVAFMRLEPNGGGAANTTG